jgi:hypothetical protein
LSFVVLIESSGNQRYIYATSKRRESLGASGLVASLAAWAEAWNAQNGNLWTVFQLLSGKVLVAVDNDTNARSLIAHTTRKALTTASGMDVCGNFRECIDENDESVLLALEAVHRDNAQARATRPGPLFRHRLMPGLEPCQTSGLPTSLEVPLPGDELNRRSIPSAQKLNFAQERLGTLAKTVNTDVKKLKWSMDALESSVERVATVHIDVNGLGALIPTAVPPGEGSALVRLAREYRDLSTAVQGSMEQAVANAASFLFAEEIPFLPILIGGDDVTIVCEAKGARVFVVNALRSFEANMTDTRFNRLSAAAGICYSRRQFPYSLAHEIASDLCASAKQVKRRLATGSTFAHASAFDAHVMLDSSPTSLKAIRESSPLKAGYSPVSGPFLVTDPDVTKLDEEQQRWSAAHSLSHLEKRVDAIRATYKGDRVIPRSQLQALREHINTDAITADKEFEIRVAKNDALTAFSETNDPNNNTLWFTNSNGGPNNPRRTRLLDALMLEEVWG